MTKARYRVTIERAPPNCRAAREGYPFLANFHKLYGDIHSGGGPYHNKEEILTSFQRFKKSWEGYGSILGRMGDKMTMANLEFRSEVSEVNKGDLFGQRSLF